MIYLNGKPVNATMFPDNTSQVWRIGRPTASEGMALRWEFSHEGEFMQLAQLKMLLDRYGAHITLDLPYLPYGRQDKDVGDEATFALHTFAKLINAMYFTEVRIRDPHSDVALELIRDSRAYYPVEAVQEVFKRHHFDLVCYPDKGALTKYVRRYDLPYMFAMKDRDPATGNLLSTTLAGGEDFRGKFVLIVDDICDGGATFCALAKRLKGAGADYVGLFVTHGLFTKGLRPLRDAGIERIFTPDGEQVNYLRGY